MRMGAKSCNVKNVRYADTLKLALTIPNPNQVSIHSPNPCGFSEVWAHAACNADPGKEEAEREEWHFICHVCGFKAKEEEEATALIESSFLDEKGLQMLIKGHHFIQNRCILDLEYEGGSKEMPLILAKQLLSKQDATNTGPAAEDSQDNPEAMDIDVHNHSVPAPYSAQHKLNTALCAAMPAGLWPQSAWPWESDSMIETILGDDSDCNSDSDEADDEDIDQDAADRLIHQLTSVAFSLGKSVPQAS